MIRVLVSVFLFFLAFGANFSAGLKYPDIEPNIWGLVATSVYLLSLFTLRNQWFFLYASIASLLTGFLFAVELILLDFAFLDILASVRYPLYGFLVMPLFSMNTIFSLSVESFSFLCAVVYMVIFMFCFVRRRSRLESL